MATLGLSPEVHFSQRETTASIRTMHARHLPHKKFVLCFDGTGNKFAGTDSDSNILKIYRMLDRQDSAQFHYYQPGIGTYVTTTSYGHTSTFARLKSWYLKAKDSAVGISFDQHVMGGYKFLMRYYNVGDEIYLFGFSRGAYTARFLAEMLDHIGLLSAGNEEMCRFAWKTFQKWQVRQDSTEHDKEVKKELLKFMCAFRETFSRPVQRIRFLGLFDTVNSVPRFENAMMERSKFPYTARSTAHVIRHAVAIDERRAKFRQDLISELKTSKENSKENRYKHRHHHLNIWEDEDTNEDGDNEKREDRGRTSIGSDRVGPTVVPTHDHLEVPGQFRDASEVSGVRSLSPHLSGRNDDGASSMTSVSRDSLSAIRRGHGDFWDSDSEEQDIQEVWFPGCHADIGGGWEDDESAALSHVSLVWMVREAERAGLRFDPIKLRALNCAPQETRRKTIVLPQIAIDGASPNLDDEPSSMGGGSRLTPATTNGTSKTPRNKFHDHIHTAATRGKIHDVLQFHNGASAISVAAWNIMEYLPFRRMDLQPDGSWKSITWPLPKGEVRDIPDDVVVHNSALRRMECDPNYRPGNLICGGGGRGVRRAPESHGLGRWRICREEGDVVGECYVRAEKPKMDFAVLASIT
ncbi:hypothetical protein EJ08DRAFT_668077 [Tothia fuscella]|uniref:T6SS Phospholipase effector Tle1-like catalytic domain-containing protein n=1 Tax=Tothia fuscella TaxID=1048955 RepID=A0A9P4P0F0_9PEZI|nr:hypothetical protein EJ08DRAFT_668077 [Tothia fuscella]